MKQKIFNSEVYELHAVANVRWNEGFNNEEYAIDEWKHSEQGQWVFEHCKEITKEGPVKFPRLNETFWTSFRTTITAYVKPADWTFYLLKWKKNVY